LAFGYNTRPKKDLLFNFPLNLLNYEKIITWLDILNRVLIERAYIELDYKEIISIATKSKSLITWMKINKSEKEIIIKNPIDVILNNLEIDINLDIPEIKVIYKEPINKEVVFKKDGLIEVINN